MAAEAVGFMARGANGGRAAELVTRDFLGGCAAADDARDAAARNDAMPGKLSVQKHACPSSPRDLNLFPVAAAGATATKPCPATAAAPVGSTAASAVATTTYNSVCTIEKVKTALERFERGKQHHHHQQQHSGAGAGASPSSSSVTTSSVKRRGGGDGAVEQGDGCDSPSGGGGGMVAAACPRCFLYVLISRSDPRCPRCESHVPAAAAPPSAVSKKPRIDLNVGFLGT
uniref:GIR1-like zinc ribbon domain-containing protein n=1 Tax=Arundo donax TaxID=35708 RepID=A0A0A9EJL6_ARUDO